MTEPIQSCDPQKSEWDPDEHPETQICQTPKSPPKPAPQVFRSTEGIECYDPGKSEPGTKAALLAYARRHPKPLLPARPPGPVAQAPEWQEMTGKKWTEGGAQREQGGVRYRTGQQNDIELVSARSVTETTDGRVKMQMEGPSVKAGIGIHNPDGSVGFNFGAQANAGSVEYSAKHGGNSASVGVSEGAGFAASAGFRDSDGDGNVELCQRVELLWFAGGYCVEVPVTLPMQKEILPAPTDKE